MGFEKYKSQNQLHVTFPVIRISKTGEDANMNAATRDAFVKSDSRISLYYDSGNDQIGVKIGKNEHARIRTDHSKSKVFAIQGFINQFKLHHIRGMYFKIGEPYGDGIMPLIPMQEIR